MMDGHTFRRLIGGLAMVLAGASIAQAADEGKLPLPALDPALRQELNAWLDSNGTDPVSYVLRLFRTRDVVILGEWHRIKHDVEFVQSLFEPAYHAGIRIFALEFARRIDQPLIDTLLASPDWNEELARRIIYEQYVYWGYQEYVGLLKTAWQLNRSLPAESPPIRIIGINDAEDWSYVRTAADLQNRDIMLRVYQSRDVSSERVWAAAIMQEVDANRKVLVYCGMHHAFSRYKQPIVANGVFTGYGDVRMGNYLNFWLEDRVTTVFLHSPWWGYAGYGSPWIYPADGVIDTLMRARPGGPCPIAFDVVGGPFGRLSPKDAVYRHGYNQFSLADYCDGWIYTKPFSEYEGVTPIPLWINDENIENTRQQTDELTHRTWTAEQFNVSIARDADIPRRMRRLR